MWPFKRKNLFKGIFSYSASSGNTGIGSKVLAVVLILLLAGGTIFILNYLGIVSIPKVLTQYFSRPQSNNLPTINSAPSPTGNNNLQQIQAVSDIKGYKIEIVNKAELMEVLKNFLIYGRTYEDAAQGYTKGVPLNKIVIHLTDKYFASNPSKDLGGNVVAASGLRISPGTFDLFIWFPQDTLKDLKSLNDQSLADLEILRSLYRSTYLGLSQDQKMSREQYLINYIKSHLDNNKRFFMISKA